MSGLLGKLKQQVQSSRIDPSTIPMTPEVIAFGRELAEHPLTFTSFPQEVAPKPSTDEEEEHIRFLSKKTPELVFLQDTLCPNVLSARRFWGIYFLLLERQLERTNPGYIEQHRASQRRAVRWVECPSVNPAQMSIKEQQGDEKKRPPLIDDQESDDDDDEKAHSRVNHMAKGSISVLAIFCPLCRENFTSLDSFYDHAEACSKKKEKEGKPVNVLELTIPERRKFEETILFGAAQQAEKSAYKSISLLRQGINDSRREEVWSHITGCTFYLKSDSGFFARSLSEAFGEGYSLDSPKPDLEIPQFNQQFKVTDHQLNEKQISHLIHILHIHLFRLGDISRYYVPFLPDMVSQLLTTSSPERAFVISWIQLQRAIATTAAFLTALPSSQHIFSTSLPLSYSSFSTLVGNLTTLINSNLPGVSKRLSSLGIETSDFCTEWFERLFVGSLPPRSLIRVFDLLLCEGTPILLRVSLSILSSFPSDAHDATSFLEELKEYSMSLTDHDKLIRTAYSFDISSVCGKIHHFGLSDLATNDEVEEVILESAPIKVSSPPPMNKPVNPSFILSEEQFDTMWGWLSPRLQLQEPVCLYFTGRDGFSLKHLVVACEDYSPLVLIVKSMEGNIFGSFISENLQKKPGRYYGTGEAFLFTISPKLVKYSWVSQSNTYFILLDSDTLAVGGGGGHGLSVDEELFHGHTSRCATFENEPLNGDKEDFEISQVEVIAFVDK
eukprot:TRINITY_DN714_c0_g1_i4.p1 TRINITY_DN714_c0_g1~~TRINITY_DN714_c0_g1_i4.p1  ORF type:complete len:733 (+),score=197.49 TRINITY_DN714_c0_g1_i4:26-2200(+)